MLQLKSANTLLQYNHLLNILLAQQWGLRGARARWRGCIEPTRVRKGLEPVMSMWSPMAQHRPTTVESVMSNWPPLAKRRPKTTSALNSITLLLGCPSFGAALSSQKVF